jgi:hypothetical protein
MAVQTRSVFTTGLGTQISLINTAITTNLPDNTAGLITPANHRLVDSQEKDSLNTLLTNLKDSTFFPQTDNTDVIILEGTTNLWFTDARARASISETITGIDYNNTTGVFSLTAGYVIPTTTQATNWTSAYDNTIVSAGFAGTTITLTQQDSGTIPVSINLNAFDTDDLAPTSTRRYLNALNSFSAFGGSIGATYNQGEIQAFATWANSLRTALVTAGVIS